MGVYKLSGAGGLLTPRVNYTSMLAGNEAYVEPGDYELIETTILGSAASSITFSSLDTYASDYKHLQIRYVVRTDYGVTNSDTVSLRFNADTGANYAYHRTWGNGSGVTSGGGTGETSIRASVSAGGPSTANVFAAGVTDVLDAYSTSKNTTTRGINGSTDAAFIFLWSGLWLNTSSVSSMTLFSRNAANLVAGSRFSLYGIRG